MYRAHCAVIFAIAQLSCTYLLIVYCRYRLVSDEGERGIRLQGHVTVKESQAVVIAELMVLVPFNQ